MAIFLILVGLLFESPKVPSKNPLFLLCVFCCSQQRLWSWGGDRAVTLSWECNLEPNVFPIFIWINHTVTNHLLLEKGGEIHHLPYGFAECNLQHFNCDMLKFARGCDQFGLRNLWQLCLVVTALILSDILKDTFIETMEAGSCPLVLSKWCPEKGNLWFIPFLLVNDWDPTFLLVLCRELCCFNIIFFTASYPVVIFP